MIDAGDDCLSAYKQLGDVVGMGSNAMCHDGDCRGSTKEWLQGPPGHRQGIYAPRLGYPLCPCPWLGSLSSLTSGKWWAWPPMGFLPHGHG